MCQSAIAQQKKTINSSVNVSSHTHALDPVVQESADRAEWMMSMSKVPTMVCEWIRPTASIDLNMNSKYNRNDRLMVFCEVQTARLKAFFDHLWHYMSFRPTS